MNNLTKTILDDFDMANHQRFREVISSKNVDCTVRMAKFKEPQSRVEICATVVIKGKDQQTTFETNFRCIEETYDKSVKQFLEWWDREISRFSTYNNLT